MRDQPASHTLVVSDLHLTEAEDRDPRRPLWMRYKHRDLHVDGCFARFLEHHQRELDGDIELVLNGDIFDFDAVMDIPPDPPFHVGWLERRRGLNSEEPKSRHKIRVILQDHAPFIEALRDWIVAGHRLVLVIGNHDMELHWRAVREEILAALALPEDRLGAVRICEWFYVSNADTLIEHGSQYDAYCVCPDALHPRFRFGHQIRMRVPFGNQAGRLMLNGMGLFNPYAESSFIKPPLEYLRFFFKHVIRVQPMLGWTWLWGAVATLVVSIREGFRPSMRDPLSLERRSNAAAERANCEPGTVRALRELRVHPAIFRPWKILRELWLDRALILAIIVSVSFQLIGFLNIFGDVSPLWALALFALLLPPFAFYARSVNSDVGNTNRAVRKRIPVALRITGVKRAVIGHTHIEGHGRLGDNDLLNTGTWSPAFEDVAYTRPVGRKCFAWIRPDPDGGGERIGELYEWLDPGCATIPASARRRRIVEGLHALRRRVTKQ